MFPIARFCHGCLPSKIILRPGCPPQCFSMAGRTREAQDPYGVSRRAENRPRINFVMMSTASRAPSARWWKLTFRRARSRTVLDSSRVSVPLSRRVSIKAAAIAPPAIAEPRASLLPVLSVAITSSGWLWQSEDANCSGDYSVNYVVVRMAGLFHPESRRCASRKPITNALGSPSLTRSRRSRHVRFAPIASAIRHRSEPTRSAKSGRGYSTSRPGSREPSRLARRLASADRAMRLASTEWRWTSRLLHASVVAVMIRRSASADALTQIKGNLLLRIFYA